MCDGLQLLCLLQHTNTETESLSKTYTCLISKLDIAQYTSKNQCALTSYTYTLCASTPNSHSYPLPLPSQHIPLFGIAARRLQQSTHYLQHGGVLRRRLCTVKSPLLRQELVLQSRSSNA